MDPESTESPQKIKDIFRDEVRLKKAVEEKRTILERAKEILDNPPIPYEPTPIAYGEEFATTDEIRALVYLRQELLRRIKKVPESFFTNKDGFQYYYYNSDNITVVCADPFGESVHYLGYVVDDDNNIVDFNFTNIHGAVLGAPITLQMGSAPDLAVNIDESNEITYRSERKLQQHISQGDAIIGGYLLTQAVDELGRVTGLPTSGETQSGPGPQNPQ